MYRIIQADWQKTGMLPLFVNMANGLPYGSTPSVELECERVTDIQASPEHKAVVEFLRGKNGPKVRRGILNGKRVDYFKGESRFPRQS